MTRTGFALAVALLTLAPGFVSAQSAEAPRVAGGMVLGAAAQRIQSDSFNVDFPVTAVNATAVAGCFFNCFFTTQGTCNASGTVSLVTAATPPVRVFNLRKGPAGQGCGGTPVTLPVTLQAHEWLLQDFEFAPKSSGSFQSTVVYHLSP